MIACIRMLCSYKNLFGAPGTGAHSYRLFNIAVVDVALTVLAGWLVAWWFEVNAVYVILGLFVAGIAAHRLFCVHTTVDTLLFV